MENAVGHLVPKSKISELDILRHEMVGDIFEKAQALQDQMSDFKAGVLGDVAAFMQMSADEYNVKLGGKKGNVSLVTFDGRHKVSFTVAEILTFDEKIHAAKAIIDECLHKWTESSDDNIKALIDLAFSADKSGNIKTQAVMGLFKLKITDPRWQQAMTALKDSIIVSGSKSYMRFYSRVGEESNWQPLSLDMAGI
ncbi:MAG: DUF3164 family protein [Methylococcales bacterium]|nr:DUF3164 family protein [Methylococcales bacterium]